VTRMTRRLMAGAIVALLPALAGCEAGLNAPTMQFHPAANGGYATVGSVTINDAFALGSAQSQSLPAGSDAGVFLQLYSSSDNGDTLISASASGVKSVQLLKGNVHIPGDSAVDLTGPRPEIVLEDLTAPVAAGGVITLTLNFASAGTVHVSVPLQQQVDAYATYQQPPVAVATSTSSASTTAIHHKKKHAHATATPTPSVTP